jgi:hypothetical protein
VTPYAVQVLIAFTTPALSGTPSWADVTGDVLAFTTSRGRSDELAVIQPGTATIVLDNLSGDYEPDNTGGPYYGDLRPMRRVRISAQATSGSAMTPVWDGYVDSWTVTTPNGGPSPRICTVECTDRFKVLARRTNTGTTVQEFAEDRVLAILENGGVDPIIASAYRNINPGGYATRTVVAYVYDKVNTLTALNDVALSDGGAMFMDAVGVFTFQGTRYRTDNTRATTSQGTFGNTDTAIPVEGDLNASVSDDIMANRVTVTCGNGVDGEGDDGTFRVAFAEDTASIAEDGLLELDIGNTLLRALDGPDRAADVLLLRKDPRPRYSSVTVDWTTSDEAMTQALEREISDRITIAFIPPGASQGYSRDQYVEAISHDVSVTEGTWLTTFSVSGGYGGSAVIYPLAPTVRSDVGYTTGQVLTSRWASDEGCSEPYPVYPVQYEARPYLADLTFTYSADEMTFSWTKTEADSLATAVWAVVRKVDGCLEMRSDGLQVSPSVYARSGVITKTSGEQWLFGTVVGRNNSSIHKLAQVYNGAFA